MITAIAFILILGLLVFIHELGHFLAAKKSGVLVEEFAFGFPPRLFCVKKGETLYCLNAIPLGGYVKLYGEEYHEVETKEKHANASRAFVHKNAWQKIFIIVAGVIGNFLLGWVLISYLFTQGIPTPTNHVVVEKVQQNSPAFLAGIKEKDIIVRIDADGSSYNLKTSADLVTYTKQFSGKSIRLVVERNGALFSRQVIPRLKPPAGQGALGVVITSFLEKKYPWYQAPFYGLVEAFNITSKIISELAKTLVQLVTFQKPKLDVAGPIGIAQYTGQAIKFGQNAVLELIALLSLNLAVMNIFPFPALDGGRLVFIIYESVTRKKMNKEVEKYLNLAGFSILIGLAIIISISDIIKLFK